MTERRLSAVLYGTFLVQCSNPLCRHVWEPIKLPAPAETVAAKLRVCRCEKCGANKPELAASQASNALTGIVVPAPIRSAPDDETDIVL